MKPSPELKMTMERFVELFLKWNAKINLSAARNAEEIQEHVRDSFALVPYLEGIERMLDVGSGGGFPVIVCAAAKPDISFVALEPVHKKHAFLRTAARELKLANLEARAERLDDHDGSDYDAACSRATFDLVQWLELGRSRVRDGGQVFGFEAQSRDDLPVGAERFRYKHGGKERAIIRWVKEPRAGST